ncbi:MAG TPA: hypothetical protein VF590_02325 [Isosphaeraceae bacterium]|jgi:hypothetical protein
MRQLRSLALGLVVLAVPAAPALGHGQHNRNPRILGCTHETAATSYSKPALEQAAARIIRICEVFLDTTELQYAAQGRQLRLAARELATACHDVRLVIDYPDRIPGAVARVERGWQRLAALAAPLLPEERFGPQARPLLPIEGFLGEMRAELAKPKS